MLRLRFFALAPLLLALVACSEPARPTATYTPAAVSSPAAAPAATSTSTANANAGGAAAVTSTPPAVATSDCTPGAAALSASSTEGPYYKAGSPERASLVEAGMAGTRIVITGTVRTADCRPVARAWLDFWQADAAGAYDNAGYRLRGHVFADAEGRYRIETIVPGEYPGRTEHIHVKVQTPDGPMFTGQLYFPDAGASNARDGIYQAQMLLRDVQTTPQGRTARFDFVVAAR